MTLNLEPLALDHILFAADTVEISSKVFRARDRPINALHTTCGSPAPRKSASCHAFYHIPLGLLRLVGDV